MDGDCAAVGWWSPNAISAAGYLCAAGVLAWWVVRGRQPRTTLLLAAVTALEGVGSLLAHGGAGAGAIFLHDLALLGIVGYLTGWHLGRLQGVQLGGATVGTATGGVVGAVVWPWYRGITVPLTAVALVAVVSSEVAARRRGLPAVWTGSLLAIATVTAVAWLAGRTGSPLCDPGSPLQLHALWHLLTAYLVVAWTARSTVGWARPGDVTRS
jgi:nitroreductase